jgi:deoxyribodipyrimidine photolyase
MHLFIFHRDLRLYDNTTLINQIKNCEYVIPIFIFSNNQINPKENKYFSHNSVQFMIESLKELYEEIKKKGGRLYFFKGDNLHIFKNLHTNFNIESIGFNIAISLSKQIECIFTSYFFFPSNGVLIYIFILLFTTCAHVNI